MQHGKQLTKFYPASPPVILYDTNNIGLNKLCSTITRTKLMRSDSTQISSTYIITQIIISLLKLVHLNDLFVIISLNIDSCRHLYYK
jgi:hypothetical protein